MTNIEGLGAVRLMESLLPELLALEPGISHVLTPDSATFAEMVSRAGIPCTRVRRRLPKALSRTLEVLFPGHHLAGPGPVLVFGDLPIRGVRNQVVFVHNFHLATSLQPRLSADYIRQLAMQFLFSRNVSDAAIVVVQTDLMRQALCQRFGIDAEKVRVIPQPVPKWVAGDVEAGALPAAPADAGLRLFYPSRAYPHKNHALLGAGRPGDMDDLIGSLELTVPADANPNPGLSWIHCVGELPTDAVIDRYHACDAVVFLSKAESYGLPLVEAMALGKPIICADLPYARALCGDGPFYFDPDDFSSFADAVARLQKSLAGGERPDWSDAMSRIPRSWTDTAQAFLDVCRSVERVA